MAMSTSMFVAVLATILSLFENNHVWTQPLNSNQIVLRGLTSMRSPYVEKDDTGKLKGYFVDLLDEMAAVGNFNYTLLDSGIQENPNDNYQSRPTGLIGEVYHSRADFAIADYLYRSPNQQRYVDITEAYLESNLSALISRERQLQYQIKSFDDLLEQQQKSQSMIPMMVNEIVKQTQTNQQMDEILQLGTIRQIYRDLNFGSDPLSRRIYQELHNNANNLVDNRQIGIERTMNTPYAFIQESINNELAVDEHCELTHIKVESPNFPMVDMRFEYGIIGQKYSPNLQTFNKAIRELKANGRLEELKRKYWNRKCNSGSNPFEQYRYQLTFFSTMFSLLMSLFILS